VVTGTGGNIYVGSTPALSVPITFTWFGGTPGSTNAGWLPSY
jgi:hypothetical protein